MKIVSTFAIVCCFTTISSATIAEHRNPVPKNILFTRNVGQLDDRGADVRYYAHAGNANFFFTPGGVIEDFRLAIDDVGLNTPEQNLNPKLVRGHVLNLSFVNRTNYSAEIAGQEELETRTNYFIGSDASKWRTDVPNYSRIVYKNVWQGIDAAYYAARDGDYLHDGLHLDLKYDVIVHPGAETERVRLRYDGAEHVSINNEGSLVIVTSIGEVIEQKPFVYQMVNGEQQEIPSQFSISSEGEISFAVGAYDQRIDLVIDPLYSSYLGGDGGIEGVYGVAIDPAGDAFVVGATNGLNFPTTSGAYQDTTSGAVDIFVAKVNPLGTKLLYSTYIGGLQNDIGYGIAVDAGGNAYITGSTNSLNFPITVDGYQKTPGGTGTDAFLVKLNAAGSGVLYCSYLGGNASDAAYRIALDQKDNIYITGTTQSLDFPVYPLLTAYQKTLNGTQDAFITKMNIAGAGMVFSTYLGGSGVDGASGIAYDDRGNVYVTGSTSSTDFPVSGTAYQKTKKGNGNGEDAFVSKISSDGSTLVAGTYLGGMGQDQALAIAIDRDTNMYVAGETSSNNFPVSASAPQGRYGGGMGDFFVTKLDAHARALVYSTYLGGANQDGFVAFGTTPPTGLVVDSAGNAYVSGATSSNNFPVTPGALQLNLGGMSDAFLTKINSTGTAFLYSTYFGGTGGFAEEGHDLKVDGANGVYLVGMTGANNFPVTPNAFQTRIGNAGGGGGGGGTDGFVTRFTLLPAISLADSIKFHAFSCEPSVETLLAVRDTLDAPFTIDSVAITGADRANFSISSPAFPVLVKAQGLINITVRYTPAGGIGLNTATLKLYTNITTPLADGVRSVALVAVRDSIGVATLTKSVVYDTLPCEERSRDSIVTVRNTGTAAVTITPTFEGMGATAFSASPASALVAPGADQTFTIHFAPSGGGAFTATGVFTASECQATDSIHLAGAKKSLASITGNPATVDYGTLTCSYRKDEIILVANTGSVSVTLEPASVTGNGFSLISPVTALTLAPGVSQLYTVRFMPTVEGDYAGKFSVGGMPCFVASSHVLIGRKDSLTIKTLKKSITFANLPCQRPFLDSFVVVRNTGTKAVTVLPVVEGQGTTSFRVIPASALIDSNKQQTFTIRFQPSGAGVYDADVIFTSPACSNLNTTHVHGQKNATTTITAIPPQLEFGDLVCDTLRDSIIVIKNLGPDTIVLDTARVTGKGFSLISPLARVTLASGESALYHIRFYPGTVTGEYNGTFFVTSGRNDCFVASTNILLGRKDSVSIVTLTKSIHFGTLECNDPYRDSIVTVRNLGSIATTAVPSVSGTGATSFTVSPPAATLEPGKSKTFLVHFQPSGSGSFDAHLTFTDSTCSRGDTVHLAGAKNSTVNVVATPATLDFGRTNCSTADSFIVVKNLGNIPVTLDVPNEAGAGFRVIGSPASVTVAPGDSVIYTVRFDPQGAAGNYAGNFSITGSPCGFKSSHILRGHKDSLGIQTGEKTITFADLGCDSTFRDDVVSVWNSGEETVTVNPVITGSGATSFSVAPLAATIAPGSSVLFTVRFQPSGNAVFDARIDFLGSPCSIVDTTRVRGRKIANGSIAGAPAFVDYGDFTGCEKGKDSVITVRNTGAITVTLTPASVQGAGFSVVSPTGPVVLPSGAKQEYVVRFAPPYVDGSYNGSFTVDASPCNLRTSHVLVGSRGVNPAYVASPKGVDFGIVAVDNTENATVTLQNISTVDVRIARATFAPATFPGTMTTALPATLHAGETMTFTISVTPKTVGVYSATMHVAIDSSCTDEVVYSVRVESIPVSACVELPDISVKKPGDTVAIPIAVENMTRLRSADSINLAIAYDADLLRIDREPTSRYGTIKEYVHDRTAGTMTFTVQFTTKLDAPKDTVATIIAMALLASHVDGTITVTPSTIWQRGKTFTSPGCPVGFAVSEENCLRTSTLTPRTGARIVAVYPNPSREKANIIVNATGASSQYTVTVTDVFGREVEQFTHTFGIGVNTLELSTKKYSSGMYFIRLLHDRNPVSSGMMNVSR